MPFSRPLSTAASGYGRTASAADRAVLVQLRRFLAVIQAFGTPRYQRADEAQLRKALESRSQSSHLRPISGNQSAGIRSGMPVSSITPSRCEPVGFCPLGPAEWDALQRLSRPGHHCREMLHCAGNPHVRFDGQGVETDLWESDLAPPRKQGGRNTHRTPKGTAPPPDPTVIQAFGTPRYQRADEAQLRKALESRRRVRT